MTTVAAMEALSASPTQVAPGALARRGRGLARRALRVVPLVALAFTFEGGAAQDPDDKPGVAQMLARLLDEGAGPYSSDAFQERLAARAIELSFNAGPDARRRLAEDARAARGRGVRAVAAGARRAALRRRTRSSACAAR